MILLPKKRRKTTPGPAEFQDSYPSSPASCKTEESPSSPPPPPPPAFPASVPPASGPQRATRSASVRPKTQSNSAVVRTPAPSASSFKPRILPSRPDEPAGSFITEELGSPSGEESLTRSFRIEPPTRALKEVCRDLAAKRAVRWRKNVPRHLPNEWHKAAILVQAVGEEQPTACYRCTQGMGPFEPCVALPGQIHKGACANCISTSHTRKCTFRSDYNPSELSGGRSSTVAPSDAPPMSRNGTPNPFPRKRAVQSMSVPPMAPPPPPPPPPPLFHDEVRRDVAESVAPIEPPSNIDPRLLNGVGSKDTRERTTRRTNKQPRWSLELPPEPELEPELVPHDTEGIGDGVKQDQDQQETVRYDIPKAFREYEFIAFPDTVNPNDEAAIGTAMAEARAICERLEGRLRKLRRASWVEEDSE